MTIWSRCPRLATPWIGRGSARVEFTYSYVLFYGARFYPFCVQAPCHAKLARTNSRQKPPRHPREAPYHDGLGLGSHNTVGAMKFGKKMIAAIRPEWGPHVYVPYESLKRTLLSLAHAETAAQAEGAFVEQLMQCLQQVNRFYTGREADCAWRLRRLAKALESPSIWLPAVAEVGRLSSEGVEVSLAAELLPQLLPQLDQEHAAALREFVDLCGEVDLLH